MVLINPALGLRSKVSPEGKKTYHFDFLHTESYLEEKARNRLPFDLKFCHTKTCAKQPRNGWSQSFNKTSKVFYKFWFRTFDLYWIKFVTAVTKAVFLKFTFVLQNVIRLKMYRLKNHSERYLYLFCDLLPGPE